MEKQFYEFALVLMIAAAFGGLGMLLRQPLIVAFIAVGISVGPAWLGITTAGDNIELLARMGIALLLFLVGLRLDLHIIRSLGPVALATGLGQVLFTSAVGFVLCLALGLSTVPAIYVAVALTFSSTIIIVKLLSDKREIDSLHGRIAVGFLIVLRQRGARILGVDFDPQVISAWQTQGHPVRYGDAEDPELAASLPLDRVQWVICTTPYRNTNLTLLKALQEHGYQGRTALTAHHTRDAQAYRESGADLVLMPFVDAAKEAADSLLQEHVRSRPADIASTH